MSEDYTSRFPVATWSRDGFPILTPSAQRLLGYIGWEGTALLAHLLTEFYDPWEHFYDSSRHADPRVLLPTEYRVRELAAAMGWSEEQVDAWMAARLLLFRPSFRMLAAAMRVQGYEGALPPEDQLLAEVMAYADKPDMDPPVVPGMVVAMEERDLRLRKEFMETCGGAHSPLLHAVLGRSLVNRSQGPWVSIATDTTVVPSPAVYLELRKQLAGSGHPSFSGSPFHERWWLEELVRARLRSACVPRAVKPSASSYT